MSELKNVKIKSIGKIKTFGDNGFKVLKWVVIDDSNPEYIQTLELQSTQENADKLIQYNKVGERVDVSYNLRGREWTNPDGKTTVFNTIEAWKVFKSDSSVSQAVAQIDNAIPPAEDEEEQDLPF